ncbi:hypothetical protein [Streptomyces sp. NBC_00691]|uniref:hypothetical protein n=1 Tax=Streptomyces sp. NBC_00691 TaxID=2903671 RepID=UPI002E3657AF|nr:hypothetical protein [Streptomyces sp. NBC_00691]
MEGQAVTQPATSRVSLDGRVRTCRPAVVRQTRTDRADEENPASQDWNIIRGED